MPASAEIDAGICGFVTVVTALQEGGMCRIDIQSDCEAVRKLAGALTEVDPFQEVAFRGEGPLTFRMAAQHCRHAACPVPVGIIKAVEVACGLALPKTARVTLQKVA